MVAKLLYYGFSLAFVVFAALQLNDPDPLVWLLVYLLAGLCGVLAAKNKLPYILVVISFVGYLFLLTYNFPPIEQWTFDHEEGREAMGLIVCGNWVAILGIAKLYKESYS